MPISPSDYSRLPESDAKDYSNFGLGLIALLFIVLLAVVVYAVGEKSADFQWHNLKRGLLVFGVVLLGICAMVVLGTGAIKSIHYFWPDVASRHRLKASKKAATKAIQSKQALAEEKARLTAQLQATFLFEKEMAKSSNAKAGKAFRDALQSSVLESCQIAFDHISQVVNRYESVVVEIESSSLSSGDKANLLDQLTRQLDVAATEQKHKDAQQLMENEIWKVRLKKARMLVDQKPAAAIEYLNNLLTEARGQRLKERLNELLSMARSKQG